MPSSLPIGETAGVLTSLLWCIGSILFTTASRRIGAFNVNAFRILLAVLLLGITHLLFYGAPIPEATPSQWFYMSLSSLIGLVIGDFAYFACLVYIGPRRGVLLLSSAPIFSTVAAYIILGETLRFWPMTGILMTMTGVLIVLSEKEGRTGEKPLEQKKKLLGITFGIIASLAQGVGLVISKYGMLRTAPEGTPVLNPLSATMIRMITASIIIWIGVAVSGKTTQVIASMTDRKARTRVLGGSITGPFLGIWLSMVAVTYTHAGIASTLMSLMPIMIIPILYLLYRQKTSLRSITGAIIAVIGVAMLFLIS